MTKIELEVIGRYLDAPVNSEEARDALDELIALYDERTAR